MGYRDVRIIHGTVWLWKSFAFLAEFSSWKRNERSREYTLASFHNSVWLRLCGVQLSSVAAGLMLP